MATYFYGHDYGNAETTGVLIRDGRHQHLTIPSHSASGSWDDLQRIRSATGSHESPNLRTNEYVLAMGKKELFVGELAITQTRLSSTGIGDISRYWSPRSLELLLVVSATLVPDHEYVLHVVTGLPVETFNEINRKKVRKALEGHHEFVLNGVPRFAHIQVLRVIMEGAGAVIAYGSTDKIRQGAIDVGGRTTDIFASDGQWPILPLCHGRPLGVEQAADLLSAQVSVNYGRPLTSSETRTVLRAYAQKGEFPKLYVNGAQIPPSYLMQWTSQALRSIGADIASFVSQTWNNSETGSVASDIARVLLVGGGAHYFREDIEPFVPHLIVPAWPEIANALGYAALSAQVPAPQVQVV